MSPPTCSKAQFKTLTYRPDFPQRFGSIEDARVHCQQFFHWYNGTHCHSGIGFMTPEAVHYGRARSMFQQRADNLNVAFLANPKRFQGKIPQPPGLPTAAWINPPTQETTPNTTRDPDIQNHIQVIAAPLDRTLELGDVPTPDFVGLHGQQFGFGIGRMDALGAPLASLLGGSEQAVLSTLNKCIPVSQSH